MLIVIDVQERLVPAMQAPARTIREHETAAQRRARIRCPGSADRTVSARVWATRCPRSTAAGRGTGRSRQDAFLLHGRCRPSPRRFARSGSPAGGAGRHGGAYLRRPDRREPARAGLRGVRGQRCHRLADARKRTACRAPHDGVGRAHGHHRDGRFRMAGTGRNARVQRAVCRCRQTNAQLSTRERRDGDEHPRISGQGTLSRLRRADGDRVSGDEC